MRESATFAPHPFHRLNDWLAKQPVPAWLFYPLLLVLLGLLSHAVEWTAGVLPLWEFNLYHLFQFAWLVEALALGHFVQVSSGPLLDRYRKLLPHDADAYAVLRYAFIYLPRGRGWLVFFAGLLVGLIGGWFGPSNQMHPVAAVVEYPVAMGLIWLSGYWVLRQISIMNRLFQQLGRVPLFSLGPVYAYSRYMAIISLWFFVIANVTVLLLSPENYGNPATASQSYFFLGFCLLIFFLPLRTINQRISEEKERELSDTSQRLERTFERIRGAEASGELGDVGELNTLLGAIRTEREMIAGTPTWPWKPGTIAALLSALFLPIAIGMVQTVIERLLNL